MTDRNRPTVCVHGLGYIGLPTAAILANTGYDVYGYDADPERRSALAAGTVSFDEADLERFVGMALDDGLKIVDSARPADFHLICVPTPYDRDHGQIDLTYVEVAGETIATVLRPGDTVVLESTVPPGTTARRLRTLLEDSGIAIPDAASLVYSPETVLPGDTLSELRENDRIVGAVDGDDCVPVVALYESFVRGEVRTTDATTAEFVKLIQNASRDVNIAFANEVAKLAHEFDIDAREAIAFANGHPRVDILEPGPGVGGHCLPIDPLFLSHNNNIPMLIETARRVNDGMPEYVGKLLLAALDDPQSASVALLGVAYKGGVADTRQSPTLSLSAFLQEHGVADLRLTDPYVDQSEHDIVSLRSALDGADAVIIVTDHPEYGALSPAVFTEQMRGRVVVDSRGLLNCDRWESAGFDVYQI